MGLSAPPIVQRLGHHPLGRQNELKAVSNGREENTDDTDASPESGRVLATCGYDRHLGLPDW